MADRRKKRTTQKRLAVLPNANEIPESGFVSRRYFGTLTSIVDPDIEAEIRAIQNKLVKTVQDIVYLCMLRFRQLAGIMKRIPKTSSDWNNVQLRMVKRLLRIKYLTDKDLKKIIIHCRLINAIKYAHDDPLLLIDPEMPACFYWTLEEVGDWLISIGCGHLKEMFARNYISGKKLISVDASALNKMGLKYFNDIQVITSEIRNILHIHRPNMMRALMRKVPFEEYLKEKQFTGENYGNLTFQKWCEDNGYPYHILKQKPLALIECTTQLIIYLSAFSEANDGESTSDHNSLLLAPTVEFNVRHILIRDRVISSLINELLQMGLNAKDKEAADANKIKCIFEQGLEDLGLGPEELCKRYEFAKLIAEEMLHEAKRTEAVLQDLEQFKRFLKDQNISEETIERMRIFASDFFSSAANIGVLLALGELDLETIFKQTPEFNAFVDGIIDDAESKLNDLSEWEFVGELDLD